MLAWLIYQSQTAILQPRVPLMRLVPEQHGTALSTFQ